MSDCAESVFMLGFFFGFVYVLYLAKQGTLKK